MILLLARHGLTDWNRDGHYLGHSDEPLNAEGQRQAERLAHRLHAEPINTIYSSDLKRSMATAAPIASSHSLTIEADNRLREMNFGLFEGLTYAAIQAQYPDMAADWFADPDCPPTGGERLSEMSARVIAALTDILARSHEHVLIMAHSGSLRLMLCHLLSLPYDQYWRFQLAPCAITQINVYEAGGILMRLNDDSHLRERP